MTATALHPAARDAEPIRPGLEGVVLAETSLSHVDGGRGVLLLRGRPVEEVASRGSFEETVVWLWTGRDATADELSALRRELSSRAELPRSTIDVLAHGARMLPMDRLRLGLDSLDLVEHPPVDDPTLDALIASGRAELGRELGVLARLPALVAAAAGRRGVASSTNRSLAASLLERLGAERPTPARVRALDAYLSTVIDHGCNASTFACRVVTSTGAGLVPSLVAAVGALAGPLHGGAPGPALDLLREIGTEKRAEEVLRRKLDAGERLMGFGHRVYAVRDPRAAVLGRALEALVEAGETDGELPALVREVEAVAVRLLDERKPDRRLRANVELYTALLLDALGIEPSLFSCVFALSRTAGWIAHRREQRAEGRLIRPRLRWRGASG